MNQEDDITAANLLLGSAAAIAFALIFYFVVNH